MATNYGIYGFGFNSGTGGFASIILNPLAGASKHYDRDYVIEALLHYEQVRGALQTEEKGTALVEVARNACRAEQEHAARAMDREDFPGAQS